MTMVRLNLHEKLHCYLLEVACKSSSMSKYPVVLPIAVVDISIGVNEPCLTVGLVLAPESIVLRAIWPFLDTLSMSETS